MHESMVINIDAVANELVELLSRNKITYSILDDVFERTKELAHSNTVNQPLKPSTNDNPS